MQSLKTLGLVAPFFPPEVGGANRYCFELAKALGEKGFEVHLFGPPGGVEDERYILHPVLTRDLRRDLQILANYKMDIWHPLFFFYAPLALKNRNVFLTGHGDDCFSFQVRLKLPGADFIRKLLIWRLQANLRAVAEGFLTKAEKGWNYLICLAALLKVRHVVAVSSFTQARLGRRYPWAQGKITVIPPGVSSGFFQPSANVIRRGNRFLSIARLDDADRIKNIHSVIGAFSRLKDDYDFEYVIIGGETRGNYRQELQSLIDANGLSSKVRLEGRKTDAELVQYYRDSDLFVLVPYAERNNFEGFGIVFLEANASGVPVLTSQEGGMKDYVKEGLNGFFAENPSVEAIQVALKKFLDGKVKFDIETVRASPEPFRWSHVGDRVVELYQKFGNG